MKTMTIKEISDRILFSSNSYKNNMGVPYGCFQNIFCMLSGKEDIHALTKIFYKMGNLIGDYDSYCVFCVIFETMFYKNRDSESMSDIKKESLVLFSKYLNK